MVDCGSFLDAASAAGIGIFCGVPDSLLKEFSAVLDDRAHLVQHVVMANEGAAIALAAGHHMASGGIGLVYMQNSGLGNAVNPLLSLTSEAVYSIPILLLIGWRGEPGTIDEPQHIPQGRVTLALLDTLDIGYSILPTDTNGAIGCLRQSTSAALSKSTPEAILVRRDTFANYSVATATSDPYVMLREEAILLITDLLNINDAVVVTTGKAARELYEYRRLTGVEPPRQEFLTVGSMGHASQIALGIAISQPHRQIYCIDGDGSLIMHMGSLAIIGEQGPTNLAHIVLNNGCHESVGGQRSAGFSIDIPRIAHACGYRYVTSVRTSADLKLELEHVKTSDGPHLLEIRLANGSRDSLGRPCTSPSDNKKSFMNFLQS